jgi:hypothetical protein
MVLIALNVIIYGKKTRVKNLLHVENVILSIMRKNICPADPTPSIFNARAVTKTSAAARYSVRIAIFNNLFLNK